MFHSYVNVVKIMQPCYHVVDIGNWTWYNCISLIIFYYVYVTLSDDVLFFSNPLGCTVFVIVYLFCFS